MNIFGKFVKEFIRAWRNGDYEVTPEGLVFIKQQALVSGVYTDYINGEKVGDSPNIWVTEGMTKCLGVFVGGETQDTTHFLSIFSGAVNPAASWDASNYPATANEITSSSEGYTESTRPAWTAGTAASNSIDNSSSAATFTIATASTLSVEGVAFHSDSAKGSTTGYLVSASRYGSTRSLQNGDNYQIEYTLTLTG